MILEDVEYLWQCMSEGFRLLNSEIGNDRKNNDSAWNYPSQFSSP